MGLKVDGVFIVRLYDKNESEGETSATEIFKLVDQGDVVFRRPLIKFNLGYTSSNYDTQRRTYELEQITNPGSPSRRGYTFKGWYASASGGYRLAFPRTVPDQDEITFYAQWEKNIPAVKGTLGGSTRKISSMYEFIYTFDNPNYFPVRIDMSVYSQGGVLKRGETEVDVSAKGSHIISFLMTTANYEWKATVRQYHSPLANINQGNNEFSIEARSSGYYDREDETTTTW